MWRQSAATSQRDASLMTLLLALLPLAAAFALVLSGRASIARAGCVGALIALIYVAVVTDGDAFERVLPPQILVGVASGSRGRRSRSSSRAYFSNGSPSPHHPKPSHRQRQQPAKLTPGAEPSPQSSYSAYS